MSDTPHEVTFSAVNGVGWIVLERPKARNALTTPMVRSISATLVDWEADPEIHAIAIRGAGDHGLCAGGDVRAMRSSAIAGDGAVVEFFRSEYRLNAQIARLTKPYVALMDGITMGGGIGVSAHGTVRIVTERTAAGMPEVTIGIAPDVGGTWLLSHAPGELGTFAALTGATLSGADAIHLGLADLYVPSDRLPDLVDSLVGDRLGDVATYAEAPPESSIAGGRAWIDRCFTGDDALAIVAALESAPEEDARAAAATIRTKSPTAVAVTLASLRRARAMSSLDEALEQEFLVSCNLIHGHDGIEGIRALIVDKDRNPQWDPRPLESVTDVDVAGAFAPRAYGSLGLVGST